MWCCRVRPVSCKWILKGGWRGAFETCEKWVIVEAAAEGVFPALAGLVFLKTRRLFMLIPGRRKRQGATRVGAGGREVVRHDGLGTWQRGSSAVCGRRAFGRGREPHLARGRVAYPVLGAWAAFTAFVKFAFVVFALNTLAGFEDFDSPGWLLGKVRSCASRGRRRIRVDVVDGGVGVAGL